MVIFGLVFFIYLVTLDKNKNSKKINKWIINSQNILEISYFDMIHVSNNMDK